MDGRQVRIWLQILPARDVPLPRLDARSHPVEERGIQPLDLLIEPRLAPREDEVRILVTAIGSRAHGGQQLVDPFLPAPQPDRIDMRVPDHVNDHRVVRPPLGEFATRIYRPLIAR